MFFANLFKLVGRRALLRGAVLRRKIAFIEEMPACDLPRRLKECVVNDKRRAASQDEKFAGRFHLPFSMPVKSAPPYAPV
jgi:hypothetical protein